MCSLQGCWDTLKIWCLFVHWLCFTCQDYCLEEKWITTNGKSVIMTGNAAVCCSYCGTSVAQQLNTYPCSLIQGPPQIIILSLINTWNIFFSTDTLLALSLLLSLSLSLRWELSAIYRLFHSSLVPQIYITKIMWLFRFYQMRSATPAYLALF